METRSSVRRAAYQRQAAEEFTEELLRRQGPGAALVLERIQNSPRYSDDGDHAIMDPGPVARATPATFAVQALSLVGKRPGSAVTPTPYRHSLRSTQSQNAKSKLITPESIDRNEEPIPKRRRITTRAYSQRLKLNVKADVFEMGLVLVLASSYLHWYEFLGVAGVNRSCRAMWIAQRESYGPWKHVLKELNSINGTNKCSRCEQVVILGSSRSLCDKNQWTDECSKRAPDFVECIDILMSSGFLSWRERGGMRRICKATYKVHKEQCFCNRSIVDRTSNLPFLKVDPRFHTDYDLWTDYEKCEALIRYTQHLVRNLHSFYNFRKLTSNECLPYGLAAWEWTDIQAINLQIQCPNRYTFAMNLVSLSLAQGELHRCPPVWFSRAFLGIRHDPYDESFADSMSSELTDQCLPPTDENLVLYLRKRCYPTLQQQKALGPLVNSLFIFSPLFKVVPLDGSIGPNRLPKSLESLNEQLNESMSRQMICTIM